MHLFKIYERDTHAYTYTYIGQSLKPAEYVLITIGKIYMHKVQRSSCKSEGKSVKSTKVKRFIYWNTALLDVPVTFVLLNTSPNRLI